MNPEEYYGERPFWCEQCLKERYDEEEEEEEGEENEEYYEPDFYLPVCNSPRMEVCGYERRDIYPGQFEPDKE